jgi:hypothetical protein
MAQPVTVTIPAARVAPVTGESMTTEGNALKTEKEPLVTDGPPKVEAVNV